MSQETKPTFLTEGTAPYGELTLSPPTAEPGDEYAHRLDICAAADALWLSHKDGCGLARYLEEKGLVVTHHTAAGRPYLVLTPDGFEAVFRRARPGRTRWLLLNGAGLVIVLATGLCVATAVSVASFLLK